ncbi:nitroreductase family protein [Govanella unica]|uniref:Putative NAD(P)H nitroreductase n=1 Tax=Govanella unica TaxID=2975056 RepID=A0A9X3Z680_9PROT|nr:nitroreductase [Govania unica]MDA5192856.1 nitroreductase [Govania unica]
MLLADILNRTSVSAKRLLAPGPTADELEKIVTAGLTAPDHGGLRPWRFIHIPDERRAALADIFAAIASDEPERARAKALNAPCLIAVVARLQPDNPKVPVREQYASVGAAITQMLLAANILGFGAIMLSGARCTDPRLLAALGLRGNEELMGFLSVGTVDGPVKPKPRPPLGNHLSVWNGPE